MRWAFSPSFVLNCLWQISQIILMCVLICFWRRSFLLNCFHIHYTGIWHSYHCEQFPSVCWEQIFLWMSSHKYGNQRNFHHHWYQEESPSSSQVGEQFSDAFGEHPCVKIVSHILCKQNLGCYLGGFAWCTVHRHIWLFSGSWMFMWSFRRYLFSN